MQENAAGGRYLCASACLDVQGEQVSKRLAHAVFDKSRAGSLELPGFPHYEPLVNALRAGVVETKCPEYQVCAPVACFELSLILSPAV